MEFDRHVMGHWTKDAEEIKRRKNFKDELESKKYYLLKNDGGNIIGYQHSRHGSGKHLTALDKQKDKGK
jgi:hypothetical protein